MAEHAGNRWYKCDLHLHTMSSKCYLDKEDTPRDWVRRALEQGITVAAVTDHNDYRGISAVMEEGREQGLAVFPGVEITCDSNKIHILVLFDTHKHADTVRDFLNRCDIDSEHIGDPDGTSLGVFEICEIAKKRGALVIAAHIDEFNSISGMNPANLDKLFDGGYIDAVQVSNVPVWRKYEADKDADAMQKALSDKYGPDATPQEVDRWRKCYNRAKAAGLPMLAFSDNPRAYGESKHGLWGIGSVYTWIQMDDVVNLESIRQSLLAPESRIRMMYDSENEPRTESDFWIRSLEVRRTKLNPHAPIHLDFNPQLNCIIGGRGSGKTALVWLLAGVYRQFPEALRSRILSEQKNFYTLAGEDERGIFLEDSEIEIRFSWFGESWRLVVSDIRDIHDQKYTFYRTDPETGEEVPENRDYLLSSTGFPAQVLTHRMINEIGMTPGALLDCADMSISDMHILKARKEYYLDELSTLSARLHAEENFLANEARVKAELDWFRQMEKAGSPEAARHLPALIESRQEALQMMESRRSNIQSLQDKRRELMKKYEECLREIRSARESYLEYALSYDDNYRIDLKPFASRESFHSMRKEMLPGDPALLSGDIRTLENALFSGQNGVKQYTDLLLLARSGRNAQDESGEPPFTPYFTHLIRKMKDIDFERLLLFRPEDELLVFYRPDGVKKYFPLTNASSGEKATAVFSFLLAGNATPLIVDQPEDDMDNRIIYEEVVRKLKKAKDRRQLIIVTHNANIAINTDPEMILSMDSHSKFVRVKMQGSADNDAVRHEVCDILEGTEKAFLQRARKYHLQTE